MTIAVAVRTDSAVVFAADSKVTTSGVVGLEEDGSPRWVEQTYDNDRSRTLMAMAVGFINIGREASTDFISKLNVPRLSTVEEQNNQIEAIVSNMVEKKLAYWSTTTVEPKDWPGPTLLLAMPGVGEAGEAVPRVWRARLAGEGSAIEEILNEPNIRMEGKYDEVFALLFGYEFALLTAIAKELGADRQRLSEAITSLKVLRPVDKVNLWAMPIQDAMDLAVFLANVQVQMDRFLPGTPACGGPIDVMVLQMAPEPGIVGFPGKVVHHPYGRA